MTLFLTIFSIGKTTYSRKLQVKLENWSLDSFCEVADLGPILYSQETSNSYSSRLENISVTILWCYKDAYTSSLLPRTARLLNYFPVECFPLTSSLLPRTARLLNYFIVECFPLYYHQNDLQSRVNKHFLSLGSF